MPADALGPIPETICSRSAQIRSCDPDRLIAFHKRRSQSAHQIDKIRNQTVYCQLNHDINHSLGNLELKLCGCDWMKYVKLLISAHDVTMGGVATSFMSADTRASWPVQCTHTVFAHDTTQFGHAIFDKYVGCRLYIFNDVNHIHIIVKYGMSKPCCIVSNTVCVHWTGHDALVLALINHFATPPIVTSWIDIISLTFFLQSRLRNFDSKFPSEWLSHDSIGNKLFGLYFLDLMSRSWSMFVECDRPIRITGSYLSRPRADRF